MPRQTFDTLNASVEPSAATDVNRDPVLDLLHIYDALTYENLCGVHGGTAVRRDFATFGRQPDCLCNRCVEVLQHDSGVEA